jgi:hypothetical protein
LYYSIDNRTDKEVGSVFPQLDCHTQIDAHRLNSYKFPLFNPILVYELVKKAKLTDVLSEGAISAVGFITNQKLKEVTDSLNQQNLKTYPVTIKFRKEEIGNYFWLHIKSLDISDLIDYDASIFYYTKFEFKQDNIKIKSYDHYKTLLKENGKMWGVGMDDIKLSKKFDQSIELFHLSPFDSTVYISKRIRDIILDKNITGIEINEAPNIS